MTELGTRPLRDLCVFKHGGTPSKSNPSFWAGDIPWVSPKDMKQAVIDSATDYISAEAVAGSATSIVPSGSILAVVRSGILAHSFPIAQVAKPLAFNQDIKAVIPVSEDVDPHYLYWFLRSQSRNVVTRGVKKGATVHSVQSGFIENLQVPMRPREDQRRIVDLLARAEGIVRLRREAQQKAAELIPAIFIDMFGDPATNSKQWPLVPMKELVGEFRYGTSQKSGLVGAPVLRIPNVVDGSMNLQEVKLVALSAAEHERLRLLDGDLLFVRTNGNPDFVGRCAVYESEVPSVAGFDGSNCVYASYLIRARLSDSRIAPTYLQAYLSGNRGRQLLRERAKTSAGQFNLNIDGLGSLPVPLPPVSLQEAFAQRIDWVASIRDRQAAATSTAQASFDALLASTFQGA